MSDTLKFLEDKYNEAQKSSSILVLSGESGIGKSYYIEDFLKSFPDEGIIRMNGHQFNHSDYFTINTAIYKLITSSNSLKKEISINILQKLALWIPRFGQQVSTLIDSDIHHKSLNDLIRRAGINTEEPRILEIIKFLEDSSQNEVTILYCDNIQWFDIGSWNLLLQLFPLITNRKWFCLLAYTTNAESSLLSRNKINDDLLALQVSSDIHHFHIHNLKRWNSADIKYLCDRILKHSSEFSESQYNLIYEYSEGLPLYVKTILFSLIDSGHITLLNDSVTSLSDWNSENIRNILKDSIKTKINRVYKTIPESRDILELGSVINDDFTDETINAIFNNTSCPRILLEVEERFRLIEYLIENRLWKFEHFLIQDYIYHSLGKKAQEIHLRIADYFDNKRDSSLYSKISIHYQLGGNYEKAALFFLKEVKLLLDSGCYQSASSSINHFEDYYLPEIFICKDLYYEFMFLKGRSMFHNVQYQSAIEIFIKLIDELLNADDNLKGFCHQWLARSFLKLNSQTDFNTAIQHLNVARSIFEKQEDYSLVGDILMDSIVAYAHMNQKDKSELLYKDAEHYFNIANDRLGMLRLQRKCIIFMDSKLAAPILKSVALGWKRLNIPHEQIMALTNAAVGYINLNNYQEAKRILLEAALISFDIGNFGQVYIHNNLGLIDLFTQQYDKCEKNFIEARNGRYRHVEQFIVDVNQSVLIAMRDGINVAYSLFKKTYNDSLNIGENDYIVPASVNWGIANYKKDDILYAYEILTRVEPLLSEYFTSYIFLLWYNTLSKCLLKINYEALKHFEGKYNKVYNQCLELNSNNHTEFAVITMEFWSEN